jgi:hypothetical protein
MRFRRSSRSASQPVYRITARIILLAAVCVAGATLLRGRLADNPQKRERNPDSSLPPSPFADLGQDVFLAGSKEVTAEDGASNEGESFEIDRALLQRVLDKTKGIPGRPYFHLVDVAYRASLNDLRQHAVGEDQIGYTNLWTQPEKHRGDTVLLKGHLRELVKFRVSGDKSVNPTGLTTLYQGALITDGSQPYPYIVVVPSVPRQMPLGTNISQDVTFAGFFLKLWRYKSASDVDRAAPLLIGRVVAWAPSPEDERHVPRRRYITLGLVAVIVCAAALVWFGRVLMKKRSTENTIADQSNPTAIKASLANLEETYDPPQPFAGLDHTEEQD